MSEVNICSIIVNGPPFQYHTLIVSIYLHPQDLDRN
jgi:hypothetical protein